MEWKWTFSSPVATAEISKFAGILSAALSVQFSQSVMPNWWRSHGQQHSSFPVLHQLLEFAQTHVHWVSEAIQHLVLCCPFISLPSIFPSIRVFSSESALRIRWPKYCSFSLSISPSNAYSRIIYFRIDWFAVQGTLKSLLQHHSLKESVLLCSAFFIVQLLTCAWLLEKS